MKTELRQFNCVNKNQLVASTMQFFQVIYKSITQTVHINGTI